MNDTKTIKAAVKFLTRNDLTSHRYNQNCDFCNARFISRFDTVALVGEPSTAKIACKACGEKINNN